MRYRRCDVLWRQSGDVLVAAGPGRRQPVALVGPAAAVWVALGEDRVTLEDLVVTLTDVFGVDEASAHERVLAILALLQDHELVEPVP